MKIFRSAGSVSTMESLELVGPLLKVAVQDELVDNTRIESHRDILILTRWHNNKEIEVEPGTITDSLHVPAQVEKLMRHRNWHRDLDPARRCCWGENGITFVCL